MKKWKNLSAVVLAVGMLAAMGISAFAGAEAEDQAQAQMQPTGMKCTKCEAGGTVFDRFCGHRLVYA